MISLLGHYKCGKTTFLANLIYPGVEDNVNLVDRFPIEIQNKRTHMVTAHQWDLGEDVVMFDNVPGRLRYAKSIYRSVASSEFVVLMVSAVSHENYLKITRNFALMAFVNGIKDIIVIINKLDDVDNQENRYNYIKDHCAEMLQNIGFKLDFITFIPIIATKMDNFVEKSDNLNWYTGPTFKEICIKYIKNIKRDESLLEKPFVLSVQSIIRKPVADKYIHILIGKVLSGSLKLGDKIFHSSSSEENSCTCEGIQILNIPKDETVVGDFCGIAISHFPEKKLSIRHRPDRLMDEWLKCGSVIQHEEFVSHSKSFTCKIIILNGNNIGVNCCPLMHSNTAQCAVLWSRFVSVTKSDGTEVLNPSTLSKGDTAIICVSQIAKFVTFASYDTFKPLSRVSFRFGRTLFSAGIILSCEKY